MGRSIARSTMVVAALVSVLLTGCQAPGSRGVPGQTAMLPARALPDHVWLRAVKGPQLSYREWRLPGACEIAGYTSTHALVVRNTHREDSQSELELLDLRTGRLSRLLARPLENERGLQFLGYGLSDDVVVWEECSPYDLENPRGTSWRLYASRYAGGKLTGKPVLLDSSDGGAKSRPLFGVAGSTVLWMNSTQLVSDTGRVTKGAVSVHAKDVAKGSSREVLKSSRRLWTMSVDATRLVVADRDPKAARMVVEAGRWDAPRWEPELTTLPVAVPSHVPVQRDGLTVFAAGTSEDAGEADLFLRDRTGTIHLLGTRANNPVFAGDFLFWSQMDREKAVHYGGVYGVRTGTNERFTLVREDVDGGWWRTPLRQRYLPGTLVIWNDRYGAGEGEHDDTLVRVYRL